jgi:MerR family transcriptional regulator, light-induced transcriptional regulator
MAQSEVYSLRQMVELTGISEFTLRGWENRYRAFLPNRSETGRRLYSLADLRRALLLRELVKRGLRISEIANLSLPKLNRLLEGEMPEEAAPEQNCSEVAEILKHTALQEWDELEIGLESAMAKRRPLQAIEEVVLPLLRDLGNGVAAGNISISQEHVLSAFLRQQLFRLCRPGKQKSETRLVLASPEGDFHDLGILVAHAMAMNLGLRSLFLGANSPKKDLCETAVRFGATHVVVSSTISRKEGAQEDLAAVVHFLHAHLPRKAAIWLGGRNAAGLQLEIPRQHQVFSSLKEFVAGLEEISNSGA